MASAGQILSRIFFWSYERGSWQYDLAVIAILVFVLLTPGRWFHDQPTREVPTASAQVELVKETDNLQTYKVDARILTPPERMPQLQNELHRALQKAESSLQNGRFEITDVEAVRDAQGAVIAYQVTLHKK
jgi:flavin-binding protein dodecin